MCNAQKLKTKAIVNPFPIYPQNPLSKDNCSFVIGENDFTANYSSLIEEIFHFNMLKLADNANKQLKIELKSPEVKLKKVMKQDGKILIVVSCNAWLTCEIYNGSTYYFYENIKLKECPEPKNATTYTIKYEDIISSSDMVYNKTITLPESKISPYLVKAPDGDKLNPKFPKDILKQQVKKLLEKAKNMIQEEYDVSYNSTYTQKYYSLKKATDSELYDENVKKLREIFYNSKSKNIWPPKFSEIESIIAFWEKGKDNSNEMIQFVNLFNLSQIFYTYEKYDKAEEYLNKLEKVKSVDSKQYEKLKTEITEKHTKYSKLFNGNGEYVYVADNKVSTNDIVYTKGQKAIGPAAGEHILPKYEIAATLQSPIINEGTVKYDNNTGDIKINVIGVGAVGYSLSSYTQKNVPFVIEDSEGRQYRLYPSNGKVEALKK
jgi:DNA-binding protein H-NS